MTNRVSAKQKEYYELRKMYLKKHGSTRWGKFHATHIRILPNMSSWEDMVNAFVDGMNKEQKAEE